MLQPSGVYKGRSTPRCLEPPLLLLSTCRPFCLRWLPGVCVSVCVLRVPPLAPSPNLVAPAGPAKTWPQAHRTPAYLAAAPTDLCLFAQNLNLTTARRTP